MHTRRRVLVTGVLLGTLALSATAQEPKRIYIAPDDHTDYMWTADEETYRQAFIEMIDYYLDTCGYEVILASRTVSKRARIVASSRSPSAAAWARRAISFLFMRSLRGRRGSWL